VLHDVIGDRMIPFAASALQSIVNGEENRFPAIGDAAYRQRAEEYRATAIGNMHKKFGKDRACGSGDILSDRHTDRRTHHNTSQPLSRAK